MKRTLYMLLAAIAVTPAFALEINLTPGSFATELNNVKNSSDTKLVLRGRMNDDDLALLKKLPATITTLDMKNVAITDLPAYMLIGSKVENFTLPQATKVIGESAFSGSNIKVVTLPTLVNEIGNYAFADCRNLTKVTFQTTPTMGIGVFRNDVNLTTVTLGSDITVIPASTFENCKKLDIAIPETVTEIGNRAFMGTALTSADLSNVTKIGNYAFASIPTLEEITLDSSKLTSVGTGAFFADSALTTLPEAGESNNVPALFASYVSQDPQHAIDNEVIGEGAYAGNDSIHSLILGANVKSIEAHAFRNLTNLVSINAIDLGSAVPTLAHNAFSGLEDSDDKYSGITLTVSKGSEEAWKDDAEWSRFNISVSTDVGGIETEHMADIRARRVGTAIEVTASAPLTRVEVFSASGMKLYDSKPNSENCRIEGVVAGQAAIVRAASGNTVKMIKLL